MELNPVAYTERVVGDFLRYQLTAYPFSDPDLHDQMRRRLSLDETRQTPLLRGPYITLSRPFRTGSGLTSLAAEGVLHPTVAALAPYPTMYGHQEAAIRAIVAGRSTVVSTGTGSGKTEAFLYPILSRCLLLRDDGAPAGIVAVIVYPMNALAEDQLGRLRGLLAGTGITFGMYVGKTPRRRDDVTGEVLPSGSSRADYHTALERAQRERRMTAVHPPEERVCREQMRTPGEQPRILLTNVKQLELLLTRYRDVELFSGARLDVLVVDEAHTFSGAGGAETAVLLRRLRSYCGAEGTVCVATSATLADPARGGAAARQFAARLFGVDPHDVTVVGELHEDERWGATRLPTPPPPEPIAELSAVLAAVEDPAGGGEAASACLARITGDALDPARWREELYDRLSGYDIVHRIDALLRTPQALADLTRRLSEERGRRVDEAEVLIWLTLGAAARREGRPLLRPVVHGFVRGLGGAVVTFPEGRSRPELWLAAEEAAASSRDLLRLPLSTCRTCGQHYVVHWVQDFIFTGPTPGGGDAVEDRVVWRSLSKELGGCRVILTDRLIGADEDDEEEDTDSSAGVTLHLCRSCGALHPSARPRCDACGRDGDLVPLLAVREREGEPGVLSRCVSCRTSGRRVGGRFWEPAREVRAVAVADVHVLAQSMLHHAHRQRLLVFADNRQDAAFQAGWMQDHARRFRLRGLMHERIRSGPLSIGDLVAHLDRVLDADDDLSRALIPEVWAVQRKESGGVEHQQERRRFLRIQVLRELTTGVRQRIGLEPWGRILVHYQGLGEQTPLVQRWTPVVGVTPLRLTDGIAALLDRLRRRQLVLDREGGIFSRFWRDGDFEVQRGYMPLPRGVPQGLKSVWDGGDDRRRIVQWSSPRGTVRHAARTWGLEAEAAERFTSELWDALTGELALLAPVTLRNSQGRPLPGTAGAFQIDADRFLIAPNTGRWQCERCRRRQTRAVPFDRCLALHCGGELRPHPEAEDDYDLIALDQGFTMVRPREHSAQVPAEEREALERMFKGEGDAVNTLVATPTLELGVDIGSLDAVLMRNVPPLPSNYWQRAGRAGRRHRMAVNLTHARPVSHDRAYFAEPLKLLGGAVEPPRFNLRNTVMIAKHVHAVVLTRLHQRAIDPSVPDDERAEIGEALATALPAAVSGYLFDDAGEVRPRGLDLAPFETTVTGERDDLLRTVESVFATGWPARDADVVTATLLADLVDGTPAALQAIVGVLHRRLRWALGQIDRLNDVRRRRGTLDPDDDAFFRRCDDLVKSLKGQRKRRAVEAEGFGDAETYGVLAAEGFLPGYGLDVGGVVATLQFPRFSPGPEAILLRRPPAMALREYVPGNLVYASGYRFTPRYYRLDPEQPPLVVEVDAEHRAVREVDRPGAAVLGVTTLRAVALADVDLPHRSHISDDEDYRSQLPVTVYGQELERDSGGTRHTWGGTPVLARRGVHLRLVNVGATPAIVDGRYGYPVCLVCGQSRSPLASQAERDSFETGHLDSCAKRVEPTGFFTTAVTDLLMLPGCADTVQAHSVLEGLRIGASRVLEMELEDLQLLVLGRSGEDRVDGALYDPMPGGSGLITMMCERWGEVIDAARAAVECPAQCTRSCIDCLQTYRNSYYHAQLDRHVAAELLDARGRELVDEGPLPARQPPAPESPGRRPVNDAEQTYLAMLLAARFPTPEAQHHIPLGKPWEGTTPDFFYPGPDDELKGVCIYVDGMSVGLHGKEERRAIDLAVREEVESKGYEVLPVPAASLTDEPMMRRHFIKLARYLCAQEPEDTVRADSAWFQVPVAGEQAPSTPDPLTYASPEVLPLLRSVAERGVDPPEIGFEAGAWPVEAAWPHHRVAVLVDANSERDGWLRDHGWDAREASEWTVDSLVAAVTAHTAAD
jgi:DEAD/DEAH box helicase/Helicase conserved C-terminal domain/MrfA Zn-binding domain